MTMDVAAIAEAMAMNEKRILLLLLLFFVGLRKGFWFVF